jgi:type I restriction-modification system DNA methylase subunit
MSFQQEFVDSTLAAYAKLRSEITSDASEFDVRHRIIKYIIEGLLKYSGKDYQAEKNRTDIRLLDETHTLPLVIIETKKPSVDLAEEKWEEQVFGYSDAFTKFVILTNGMKIKVWSTDRRQKTIIDLDFENFASQTKLTDEHLTVAEKAQILILANLTKDELWSDKKYENFHIPNKINIVDPEGFIKLIDKIGFVQNQLLLSYMLSTFNEYNEGFLEFEKENRNLEKELTKVKGNIEFELRYQKEKQDLQENCQRFIDFRRGYGKWLEISSRDESEKSREVFCIETIYVLLNKILLIRICEDKGLVTKKISNSGISVWRQFAGSLKDSYKDLLDIAYKDTSLLYSHVYEKGIFDWYSEGDGELNKVLNRVLYIFNHFSFKNVNRDILGKLYEKYLPKDERKELGEFYTPEEVIDYILDSIGYCSKDEIEGKNILDPACGSGGFLVRATNRLIERYKEKGLKSKEIINNVATHVYGFDINPFACHIAEMNLLFQVIDLYQEAKEEDQTFVLPRFNIYQSDSLEKPLEMSKGSFLHKNALAKWLYPDTKVRKYIEERETVEKIKNRKFDFVVGNPPYVRIEKISEERREYYKEQYIVAKGRFDLYMLFIERGVELIEENGKLSFITSNRFMKTDTAKALRRFLVEKTKILQIVDFGDVSLFESATNYPCIFVLENMVDVNNKIWFAEVNHPQKDIMKQLEKSINKEVVTEFIKANLIEQKLLTPDIWRPMSVNANILFQKIDKCSENRLGQVTEWNLNGIFTGLNDVFIIDEQTLNKYRIESEVAKPLLVGEDVRKWKLNWSNNYIVYTKDIDFEKAKNTLFYLKEHEKELAARVSIRGTGIKWYELSRPRDQKAFERKKIVTPRLATENNFALDETGQYYCGDTTYVIVPDSSVDIYYLLGLLNSKVLSFYLKQVSPFFMDKYFVYNASYTERFPIIQERTCWESLYSR